MNLWIITSSSMKGVLITLGQFFLRRVLIVAKSVY